MSLPVFIVGVPRSGTTLLRVILDSHPNLAVGPECPWIGGSYGNLTSFKDMYRSLVNDQRGPVRNFEGISDDDVALAIGSAISNILQAYAIAQGKKRWVEKTPNHITDIPFIAKLFPRCKYIHIVRDGRDVACSSYNERVTWGPELINGEERLPNTRLNALQRWCQWVSQFEKWQRQFNMDVCRIRYEDLLRNPRSVIEDVLDFIEEPWVEDVLNFKDFRHDMPAWEAGSRDVLRSSGFSKTSVDRWKKEFSDTERSIAASFADHTLLRLGYEGTLPPGSQKSSIGYKRIHLLRTDYKHWGECSGYYQFLRYLNTSSFKIDVQTVSIGDNISGVSDEGLKRHLRYMVRKNGVREYDLNDLSAELVAFRRWWNGDIDLFHYLDGEHSLQYLPVLLHKLESIKSRSRIVATFHQPPEVLDSLLNIEIVRLLDHVIAISPEQVSYFEQFLPANKISLILHGVDIDYFRPGSEQVNRDKFRCISVGSWLRDYDTAMIVAEMFQSYPDIEFHIVSPISDAKSLPDNVYAHSGISDDELLRMYQQADVLFLPLINATANNAILEGLACGLPIVTTELPSTRTYAPGREAILIPDNNPGLFKSGLLQLYNNPGLRNEMSRHARKRAVELSWSSIASKIESLYFELIANKKLRNIC